jgi:hypothetical protein
LSSHFPHKLSDLVAHQNDYVTVGGWAISAGIVPNLNPGVHLGNDGLASCVRDLRSGFGGRKRRDLLEGYFYHIRGDSGTIVGKERGILNRGRGPREQRSRDCRVAASKVRLWHIFALPNQGSLKSDMIRRR